MIFQDIVSLIKAQLGEDAILNTEQDGLQPVAVIHPNKLLEVATLLFTSDELYFDYLSNITGVDNGVEANTMEVLYHLYSIPYDHHFIIRCVLDRNTENTALPSIPSVCGIWRTANWHERETYDLLGIRFTNHPDLRRILLPGDWEGYPLRKDYVEQEKYGTIKVAY